MAAPVLLIHGLGVDGSIWDGLRRYLESEDFTCEAPTLFPELRTVDNPAERLKELRFQDYVDEVKAHVFRMEEHYGQKPIVIGHAGGGLIAQILAGLDLVSKAIFITPAPPRDCRKNHLAAYVTYGNLAFVKRHDNYVKIWKTGFSWGYLNCVPKSRHDEIYSHVRYESVDIFREMSEGVSIDERYVRIPTLTIIAGKDRAVSPMAGKMTAEKYARANYPGDFRHYPDHGHWIIDEPGTGYVASDMLDWLEKV
ncbi:MAG: alpha/beta hydrolase [Ponticaulis sp.]|nr:alpha/beta hydrolase [Ponticaulis sp.]|tara:strand:+ start:19063 stop:19821 length:759 start_codon:yes stop_codon:yes gene_type:complete